MDSSQTPGGRGELPSLTVGEKAETDFRSTELLQRAQWLRAAILGANDGLLSTTSLMLGVGAAKDDRRSMVLSGIAGALAGSLSMAVGEFVSVSTQREIERANLEKRASVTKMEKPEEIMITVAATKHDGTDSAEPTQRTPSRNTPCRMLICKISEKSSPATTGEPQLIPLFSPRSPALKVLAENSAKAKQERIDGEEALPNPYKAAAASALAFLCGSLFPLLPAIFVAQNTLRIVIVAVVASIALALFGGIGAHLGGSPVKVSAVRVLVGGWIAMGITYGLLKPFDKDDVE
ncbi:vacuolar iron transporter homolog 4-like [Syzygium oleosum]|uniref:vacuolar iron transporter homolog 4-like n=1 Tax=Syzygium oleosum TaxID=219896 RepID=UPI0011D18F27|nr:vacuolar iron transporter homolog 4-like [Syzygium oleosum]